MNKDPIPIVKDFPKNTKPREIFVYTSMRIAEPLAHVAHYIKKIISFAYYKENRIMIDSFTDKLFGVFVKNEGTYKGEIALDAQKVTIYLFLQKENIQTLHSLYPRLHSIIEDCKKIAADNLLNTINTELLENENKFTIDKQELIHKMELCSIVLQNEGCYRLVFNKQDILPENPITISGSLKNGFTGVALEFIELLELLR